MSPLGPVRLCRPRPPTVRFTLHCRHAAALSRTGGLGHIRRLSHRNKWRFYSITPSALASSVGRMSGFSCLLPCRNSQTLGHLLQHVARLLECPACKIMESRGDCARLQPVVVRLTRDGGSIGLIAPIDGASTYIRAARSMNTASMAASSIVAVATSWP